jgi:hypothetical protein
MVAEGPDALSDDTVEATDLINHGIRHSLTLVSKQRTVKRMLADWAREQVPGGWTAPHLLYEDSARLACSARLLLIVQRRRAASTRGALAPAAPPTRT